MTQLIRSTFSMLFLLQSLSLPLGAQVEPLSSAVSHPRWAHDAIPPPSTLLYNNARPGRYTLLMRLRTFLEGQSPGLLPIPDLDRIYFIHSHRSESDEEREERLFRRRLQPILFLSLWSVGVAWITPTDAGAVLMMLGDAYAGSAVLQGLFFAAAHAGRADFQKGFAARWAAGTYLGLITPLGGAERALRLHLMNNKRAGWRWDETDDVRFQSIPWWEQGLFDGAYAHSRAVNEPYGEQHSIASIFLGVLWNQIAKVYGHYTLVERVTELKRHLAIYRRANPLNTLTLGRNDFTGSRFESAPPEVFEVNAPADDNGLSYDEMQALIRVTNAFHEPRVLRFAKGSANEQQNILSQAEALLDSADPSWPRIISDGLESIKSSKSDDPSGVWVTDVEKPLLRFIARNPWNIFLIISELTKSFRELPTFTQSLLETPYAKSLKTLRQLAGKHSQRHRAVLIAS